MKNLFETPQQIVARLEKQIAEYTNELEAESRILRRQNWCIVDADFELFAVKKNTPECLTFGDDADFYTRQDAETIAANAVYRRKDGKRVNLKVMSTRQFIEMKMRKAQDALEIITKALAEQAA